MPQLSHTEEKGSAAERKTFRLEIFLISLAAILLEISMTRIFSFKLYYYFTFLVLGVALLGLGAGGVFVAVFPAVRRLEPARLISWCCLAAGVIIPVGYHVVALTQVNVLDLYVSPFELLKLFIVCTCLFTPFLLVGIVLATIFGNRPEDMNRLYFADLMGAGLGCAVCVPLFTLLTPPGSALLSGLVLALAGGFCGRRNRNVVVYLNLGVSALIFLLLVMPDRVPDPVADRTKTMSPQRLAKQAVLFSGWSSVFRVDVVKPWTSGDYYTLHHDGNIGSAVYRFDGDYSSLRHLDKDIRSKPFTVLDSGPKVLIIGSAGGLEIMASLYFGASRVTAVELNPVTVSLLTDQFADFTGRIAEDSRVTLVNAEGRSFLERSQEKFDLIWLVAPDSYAAMNAASSGAYVLAESYLYTVEMIMESLVHLREGGVLCAQFGEPRLHTRPNRTPRYVSTAREAFRRLGIGEFSRHIIVSTGHGFLPGSTTLLSREPFPAADLERYRANLSRVKQGQMWHPRRSGDSFSNTVTEIISLREDDLKELYDRYLFDVRPVGDDSPFFWHFVKFRDAVAKTIVKDPLFQELEVATGERTLLVLLAFAAVFAAVFIFLPILAIREVWREIPNKGNAAIYFSALGLGFMFFEVCLIQKLTLFLGYPSYSLTVTLFGLLVFSGIGSLLSVRYSKRRNRALLLLVTTLALLTLLLQFGVSSITDRFGGSDLPVRVALTVILLAPVGLCLGAFMPIGIATIVSVTKHEKEYVAWAWAVNGFFSVVSSVLGSILSMTIGFRSVFLIALLIYLIGAAALSRIPEPEEA